MDWSMRDMRREITLIRGGKDDDPHTLCQQSNMYSLEKVGRSDHLATLPARASQTDSPESFINKINRSLSRGRVV